MPRKKTRITPGIYVKLPSGTWVRVQGKLERFVRVSRRSRGRTRTTVAYTLIGESLDKEPQRPSSTCEKIYVSSSRITKLLIRLLDELKIKKELILIYPKTKETYVFEIYRSRAPMIEKIRTIAEELKILKHVKEKTA